MVQQKREPFSLKKRAKSFVYAARGIRWLFAEHNAWIHLVAAILVVIAGFLFGITHTEWMIICICIGSVFAAEAFNTAIEKLSDVVSPQWNNKIGKVKDLAAGAVLITAITAAIVGLIIFIPYFC